ncbi:MAG: flagellar motor protein MotA [Deltaproteobacteria bacterium RIFOXYD12_FULL_57_12]|nr:MAG: flagellar motor protein MotA [Deltaproteobacteria bacterium RIFOXYD12_FULL_57_12]
MDIATIIGLIMGFGAVIGGQVLEGGHVGALMQPTAALIVMGGTFGATFVAFPLKDIIQSLKDVRSVLLPPPDNMEQVITDLVSYADLARHNGILSLEKLVDESIKDKFVAKGMRLLVDGTDPQQFREVMDIELESFEANGKISAEFFESAGGFAPTIGIIGAVLGLIHVMSNLSDSSKLGAGIAVAFVATIYGLMIANIVCIPFSTKLKKRLKEQMTIKNMILEGLLDIQAGQNPRVIKQKLRGFLPPGKKLTDTEE